MLTLYYSPGASSVIPHITLEEIRVPYQRKLINLAKGEHKTDAYLKINPHGKVPALCVDGNVLTENVAILTYLAKQFPDRATVAAKPARRSSVPVDHGMVRERRSSDLRAYHQA